ncbi:unnamed protein product [Clavelina lepadiformis]|uniref:Uncharacterized protein n=1 Tax=Clavelina lepadiformis TaxID=159417 RepID=A0ABP0F0M0_CLALP
MGATHSEPESTKRRRSTAFANTIFQKRVRETPVIRISDPNGLEESYLCALEAPSRRQWLFGESFSIEKSSHTPIVLSHYALMPHALPDDQNMNDNQYVICVCNIFIFFAIDSTCDVFMYSVYFKL